MSDHPLTSSCFDFDGSADDGEQDSGDDTGMAAAAQTHKAADDEADDTLEKLDGDRQRRHGGV